MVVLAPASVFTGFRLFPRFRTAKAGSAGMTATYELPMLAQMGATLGVRIKPWIGWGEGKRVLHAFFLNPSIPIAQDDGLRLVRSRPASIHSITSQRSLLSVSPRSTCGF